MRFGIIIEMPASIIPHVSMMRIVEAARGIYHSSRIPAINGSRILNNGVFFQNGCIGLIQVIKPTATKKLNVILQGGIIRKSERERIELIYSDTCCDPYIIA